MPAQVQPELTCSNIWLLRVFANFYRAAVSTGSGTWTRAAAASAMKTHPLICTEDRCEIGEKYKYHNSQETLNIQLRYLHPNVWHERPKQIAPWLWGNGVDPFPGVNENEKGNELIEVSVVNLVISRVD
jgi:hypothetical protein